MVIPVYIFWIWIWLSCNPFPRLFEFAFQSIGYWEKWASIFLMQSRVIIDLSDFFVKITHSNVKKTVGLISMPHFSSGGVASCILLWVMLYSTMPPVKVRWYVWTLTENQTLENLARIKREISQECSWRGWSVACFLAEQRIKILKWLTEKRKKTVWAQ